MYLASNPPFWLRQVFGNNAHDRFWGQVLRWAVASDLPAGGKFVRFVLPASPPRTKQASPSSSPRASSAKTSHLTPASPSTPAIPSGGKGESRHRTPTSSRIPRRFSPPATKTAYPLPQVHSPPPGDVRAKISPPPGPRSRTPPSANDPSATQKTYPSQIKILPQPRRRTAAGHEHRSRPPRPRRPRPAMASPSMPTTPTSSPAHLHPHRTHTEEVPPNRSASSPPPTPKGPSSPTGPTSPLFALLLTIEWATSENALGLV